MTINHRLLKFTLATLIGGGAAGTAYAFGVEPDWIDITRLNLTLPRLDHAFDGYSLIQFSDFHLDTWLGRERLESVVARINDLDPDLVAFTGDFVSEEVGSNRDDLITALKPLKARDGVVGIFGNHDYRANIHTLREVMHEIGMIDLNNRVFTLKRNEAQLHIAGVDDILEGQPDLKGVLAQLSSEGAAILLAHEPDYADISAGTGRFDLQLSGHSHGGQIRLPLLMKAVLPPMGEKYHTGLYRVEKMLQYTNRGIGMVRIKARFNCRPEITVFTLRAGV